MNELSLSLGLERKEQDKRKEEGAQNINCHWGDNEFNCFSCLYYLVFLPEFLKINL